MKIFTVIFCLLMSVSAWGQSSDTMRKDSSMNNHKTAFIPGRPMIVVDGVIFPYDSLKNLSIANIISIDTLKNSLRQDTNPNLPDYGTIIYVTKQGAIKSYQKKFSIISKKYKKHLEHQKNDRDIGYIINGIFLGLKPDEQTKTLYEIPAKKIKSFDFTENRFYNGGVSRPYIVIIITKK